jgi:hypothetical protein
LESGKHDGGGSRQFTGSERSCRLITEWNAGGP